MLPILDLQFANRLNSLKYPTADLQPDTINHRYSSSAETLFTFESLYAARRPKTKEKNVLIDGQTDKAAYRNNCTEKKNTLGRKH